MNKRVAIRLIIGLFLIAGLVLGYQWYQGLSKDLGGVLKSNTKGFLAALEYDGDGARAVIFKPDGTKIGSPDYQRGTTDRDLAWSESGDRLFFTSNRADNVYAIYRWDPQRGNIERRTAGTRSMSNLAFAPGGETALVTSGGFVLEFDPKEKTTKQLLPPTGDGATTNEDGGTQGQFDAEYQRIGTSFKKAKWGLGREWIIATMRRENGEVLVMQSLVPQEMKLADGTTGLIVPPPFIVDAAERIDFDVAADGNVVYSAIGFQFKDPEKIPQEFIKNGRVVPPFRNLTAYFDPAELSSKPPTPIFVSTNDSTILTQPICSPDSAGIAYIAGTKKDGAFVPLNLVLIPMVENGATKGTAVASGEIREVTWNIEGTELVYAKSTNGKRGLYKVSSSGGQEEAITKGGDYGMPLFSPQR